MPLVYQGRLNEKTIGSPTAALEFGRDLFEPITSKRRLDLRLSWERAELLDVCRSHLSDSYGGLWMDIALHADIDVLPQVARWAATLRNGHVSLICLQEDRQTEVRITLPGVGPERYDDERYEARFGYDPTAIVIKSVCLASPGGMTKDEKAYSAGRMRGAYQSLSGYIEGECAEYVDWLRAHTPKPSVDLSGDDDSAILQTRRAPST